MNKSKYLVAGSAVNVIALSTALSATSVTISAIQIDDSGDSAGAITLAKDQTAITTDTIKDLNLVNFTVGSTTYNSSDFVSGVGVQTSLTKDDISSVIQPNGHQDSSDAPNPDLYVGDPNDLSGYLTSGERGLSFSTGLNFRPAADSNAILSIAMSFNSDPSLTTRPTFIVGDAADGQSNDTWEFFDASGNSLGSIGLSSSDWHKFGDQKINRVLTGGPSGTGNDADGYTGGSDGEGTDLGLAMTAFYIDSGDISDWSQVAELRVTISEDGNSPKTDYAFFGVDVGIVDSPDLVAPNTSVPEPSSIFFFAAGGMLLLNRRRR
ncbi:MAG: PEP-CTERM sorting domain-containing protein [Akkermansiaceae bacterium]